MCIGSLKIVKECDKSKKYCKKKIIVDLCKSNSTTNLKINLIYIQDFQVSTDVGFILKLC